MTAIRPIDSFRLQYDFLSNFYPAWVTIDGVTYLNSEAAFHAYKCMDPAQRPAFARLNPKDAKRMGRRLPLRPDWETVKTSVMERIVREKFTQNPELAQYLLDTGDAELVEGNKWHDTCWGVDITTGQGENRLGRILMALRQEFREQGLPQTPTPEPLYQTVSPDGLTLVYQDITRLEVDAIVNAANETLLGGGGVDAAIHRGAGPELLAACRPLGGCAVTEVKVTHGFRLKARYVLHTVGPRKGVPGGDFLLAQTYRNVLDTARELGCASIAFPAISAGKFAFPKEQAALVAVETIRQWKAENPDISMHITFACVDVEMYDYFLRSLREE